MMEDITFDPLTDTGGPLDPEADADAADAERRAYAALFAHAGVTDPNDWRTVALNLACQYNPALLMGLRPCASTKPASKGGRPKKCNIDVMAKILYIIKLIRSNSTNNLINRNLSTSASACDFFANDPLAAPYRDLAWMIPPGITAETLQNKLSEARRQHAEYLKRVTETA